LYPILAKSKRADATEEVLFGFLALVEENTFFTNLSSEINKNICLRSTAKLFQTLTCLNLGLDLSEEEIAIATSSHSGEEAHVNKVTGLLGKYDLNWKDLDCGEHPPLNKNINTAKINTLERRLQNNCSGKHSMMLATCKLMDWPLENYRSPNHPLQQAIKKTIADNCNLSIDQVLIGNDGCGVPTFAIPAKNLLMGFGSFQKTSEDPNKRKIAKALTEFSLLVSGKGRLDHEMTIESNQNLLVKSGAGGITLVANQSDKQPTILIKTFDNGSNLRACFIGHLIENLWNPFSRPITENSIFSNTIKNLHNENSASIELEDPIFTKIS
jgi:L-asparaginase II